MTQVVKEGTMYTADQIQARLREQPFVPFQIVTNSGQTYDVKHPDAVQVGKRSLIIGIASINDPAQFKTASRVAVIHVIDLRDLPDSAPSETDGPAA
jgi:hypothetical protein